jgi:hypothetical protein
MTNIKLGRTIATDPLEDKLFDFQFVNPPCGYEWSEDHDAVTIREPMQSNLSVRQRPGQRGLKPESLPPEEDIKKLERWVSADAKKLGKQAGHLPKPGGTA